MTPRVRIVEHGVASPSALAYPIVKKSLRRLLRHHRHSGKRKVDLCCGNTHGALPFTLTNDKDPSKAADRHSDALQLLRTLEDDACDLVFFDPPFTDHQVLKQYDNHGANIGPLYIQAVFVELERVLAVGDQAVICGFDGAVPGGLREDLLLLCNGGGDNPAMVVAIASKGPCAPLPDRLVAACVRHSEAVDVELVDGGLSIHRTPQVHASISNLLEPAKSSVSVCDPGNHGLAFTRANNIRWGTPARPNVEDVDYLKRLKAGSQQVAMCKSPTIQEGGKLYRKYKMMFTRDMPKPTSAAYPSALKQQMCRVLAPRGHAIWVGECVGVGFKTRKCTRKRVFMQRRGLRMKAHYVCILQKEC